ncbi:uncharacterized protein [Montipora foliosa]|uniref:uncharacterized protein n=1 Tax=Montipora foliosa TaxID=591990 RepID=UPI0035F1E58B
MTSQSLNQDQPKGEDVFEHCWILSTFFDRLSDVYCFFVLLEVMSEAGDSSESTSEPKGQPVSGLKQSTLLEQSSVNLAILESLERLNQNFAAFSEYQYPENDYSHEQVDEVGERSNVSSPVDIHQEVNAIVNPVNDSEDIESSQDKPRNDESDIVDYDSQLDLNIDTKGPKINDKVAGVVNKLCLQRISQDQSKAMIKRHSTPQNVNLKLPKCEPSIWNEIPGKTRVNDIKFQSTQALLIASVNCQLEVAENLLKTKSEKQVITTCLDGITLAMASNYELNLRRRDAMRPHFKSEFAKGLCSSTNPADEFLFGGDTAKRIKEIAELNKNKVCKAQPSRPQGRGQRFSPYPQRGFRGYIRGRGRAFRGRGSGPSGYQQQQQQYFQHAPQSEKKSGSRANQN